MNPIRIAVAGLVSGLLLAVFTGPSPAFAQNTANVTINAASTVATMPPQAVGLGTAVYDAYMCDPAVAADLLSGGFNILRYPGGSYADQYDWHVEATTPVPPPGAGSYDAPGTGFGNFMTELVGPAGATAMITLDYGENSTWDGGGDPLEAAAWVAYCNGSPTDTRAIGTGNNGVDWQTVAFWAGLRAASPLATDDGYNFLRVNHPASFGVKYWEVGNELYGNGFYDGVYWEDDLHDTDQTPADRAGNISLSPTAYGANVAAFSEAMKTVDPTIMVGAVLITPSFWPDGVTPDWNSNVLAQCGANIDAVVIHFYPGGLGSDLFSQVDRIPGIVAGLKSDIDTYCGANAAKVQIWCTEGSEGGTLMDAAIYGPDEMLTWFENGVTTVDWQNEHNGISIIDGENFDSGIFANFSSEDGFTEPPVDTPFPSYYGLSMVHYVAGPGDTLVAATSDTTTIKTHAARKADGSLAVMIDNQDPSNAATVNVSVSGQTLGSSGTMYQYTNDASAITTGQVTPASRSSLAVTVPAYSVTVVDLPQAVLQTFPTGLQMIAAPASYEGDTWSQIINPATTEIAVWQPGSSTYAVAPTAPANTILAGSGYWVKFTAATTLFDTGTHTDPTKPVFVTLGSGWNMIGDPFSTSVPISSLEVTEQGGSPVPFLDAASSGLVESTLFSYPAGAKDYHQESQTMSPYTGYWLWTKLPAVLIVPAS